MVSAESQAAMDAARRAVSEFLARSGHHNTTVHEKIAAAITHETVTRKVHEEEETVVDREVHADHYHLSVQPITDEETLEPQHSHNLLSVEQKSFEHDDRQEVEARLASERAKFRDELVRVEGEKTQTVNPIITGEHIHHHVHELIQPVINKQTIEPIVIHTTVQIHEIHHNAAQHHAASALPAVTMAEFKRQGGILTGREERYDFFEGEPRSVGGNVGNIGENGQRTTIQAGSSDVRPAATLERESRGNREAGPGRVAAITGPAAGPSVPPTTAPTAPPPAPPAPPMPPSTQTPSGMHPPRAGAPNANLFPAHLTVGAGGIVPRPSSPTPQLVRPGRANNQQRQGPGAGQPPAQGQQGPQGRPSVS